MQKLISFFWFCSGADTEILKRCPTETAKYTGIGATVFFTGLFAFVSASYALYTVFDNFFSAVLFGIVWGLMIFNLDRFIVSSMRKEGRTGREFAMAIPRLVLAILISVVIARPLELKIFEKEIAPELVVMEQEKYAVQEVQLTSRFTPYQDSVRARIGALKTEISDKAAKRDELLRIAQEEADGTGGSRRRNLGPIYNVKKADADRAELELSELTRENQSRIASLETLLSTSISAMNREMSALERSRLNGPAARMEALDRITAESSAILWAHWFILLLFIAIETAPVFVKLISPKGPYDNLLRIAEHGFIVEETESTARANADSKKRAETLPDHERTFLNNRLDAELNR
ncbi:MAG: DUF4407 domain-containing protein [Bacteroidota bacterium]|nr:DUF4407 domain-containing protein [Bacteroidota bacterium]